MQYTEVKFVCPQAEEWQKDLLIQDLAGLGFDSFEDIDEGFLAYIPSSNLDLDAVDLILLQQMEPLQVQYEVRDIEQQNWNAVWEGNFQPIEISGRCYVRATFHAPRPDFQYEIVIDPKMAFGTGHHQTTAMMMRYLLDMNVQDKSLLDMGCGTGILAILAGMRGAKPIFAVDYDPVCYDSTRENLLLNEISGVEVACGSAELLAERKFDIILANINRNILLEHFSSYAESCQTGGYLVISGFFVDEDLQILRGEAEALGFRFDGHLADGKWAAARFVRI